MGIASSSSKIATKLLGKFGGNITIKRDTSRGYDIEKGEVHKNLTTVTVKGAIENVVQREVNDLVSAQDKKVTISAGDIDFVPQVKDFVFIASIEYKIIQVDTNEVQGEEVTYELYLRG